MSTAVATKTEKAVARPLHVLVPLIKKDLQEGREASRRAALPYFQAAGEKMLEAKPQMKHGEFRDWIARNFDIKQAQATEWMALAAHARENTVATVFSTLSEFQRETGRRAPDYNTYASRQPAWREPVNETIDRAKAAAERIKDENLSRAQEREAQRKLALQLIDIGYKILSKELHPDKGGSRDAMARLNQVRDRLRTHA